MPHEDPGPVAFWGLLTFFAAASATGVVMVLRGDPVGWWPLLLSALVGLGIIWERGRY